MATQVKFTNSPSGDYVVIDNGVAGASTSGSFPGSLTPPNQISNWIGIQADGSSKTLIPQLEPRPKARTLRRMVPSPTTLVRCHHSSQLSSEYPIAFQESGVSQFQFGWTRPVFFSARSSTTYFLFKDYSSWLTQT